MTDKRHHVHLYVPHGIRFSDLQLSRDPVTGTVSFDWRPLESICEVSGLDISLLRDAPQDNVSGLLVAWYAVARQSGEPLDLVQEQLLAELAAENAHGNINVLMGSGRLQ